MKPLSLSRIRKLLANIYGDIRVQHLGLDGLALYTHIEGKEVRLCLVTADKPEGRPGLPWAAFVGALRAQGFEPKRITDELGDRIEMVEWKPPPAAQEAT